MTGHDPLLQPYQLKHLTLRNRLMTTAHEPAYTEDGMPKDRYRRYHAERAKGGIAMTMTAGSAVVSPDSPPSFGNILAYKDEVVPWMKALADECHEHGSAVMIQLTHLGRRTSWNLGDWLPVMSASPIREIAHRGAPKAAEDWDLDRVVQDYADAAARMQEAGLDGIEVEAYGHLLDSFWSPAWNHRDDEYGGSIDNRMRLYFRVVERIRETVGDKFIVGTRLVLDEAMEGGITREEGREIAKRIVASGKIDFLNVIRGHMDTDASLVDVIPIMGMRSNPHLDFAGEVRAETKFPVFHAAKIADVATARHAVAEGKLDMVGMTRAHLADPHIVRKIKAGQEERIRPCVGATYCLDRIYEGGEALCVHNAATGREGELEHVHASSANGHAKKVVVVGGGPAGLEAARVCAERGHKVVLFEAQNQAGGQVQLLARGPRRKDMIGIVEWRVAELERMGAEMRFDTYAEADEVTAEEPDVVLIATGGLPNTSPLNGGAELVASSWDVLAGEIPATGEVLVYDDWGGHQALQAAEVLAKGGASVELVTPERTLGVDIGGMNHVPYARCFQEHGVRVTINRRLMKVERAGNRVLATLASDYSPKPEERVVDRVVFEHGTLPMDELYFDLKPLSSNRGAVDYRGLIARRPIELSKGGFSLFRLGDAIESRNIHAAIYDAARLCSLF